jgi:hypothetical protein
MPLALVSPQPGMSIGLQGRFIKAAVLRTPRSIASWREPAVGGRKQSVRDHDESEHQLFPSLSVSRDEQRKLLIDSFNQSPREVVMPPSGFTSNVALTCEAGVSKARGASDSIIPGAQAPGRKAQKINLAPARVKRATA